ncbi:hypothetical protein C2S52_006356 [Perilla frutescens var. hirtella]|nr:hypothetical protein C2S52_006356 [Perilla frutescens var. hirtella]
MLILYFYEGLVPSNMSMIDAASGGALMNKTLEEAMNLISIVADNDQQFTVERSRKMGTEEFRLDNMFMEMGTRTIQQGHGILSYEQHGIPPQDQYWAHQSQPEQSSYLEEIVAELAQNNLEFQQETQAFQQETRAGFDNVQAQIAKMGQVISRLETTIYREKELSNLDKRDRMPMVVDTPKHDIQEISDMPTIEAKKIEVCAKSIKPNVVLIPHFPGRFVENKMELEKEIKPPVKKLSLKAFVDDTFEWGLTESKVNNNALDDRNENLKDIIRKSYAREETWSICPYETYAYNYIPLKGCNKWHGGDTPPLVPACF